jgi:hypothetical protein
MGDSRSGSLVVVAVIVMVIDVRGVVLIIMVFVMIVVAIVVVAMIVMIVVIVTMLVMVMFLMAMIVVVMVIMAMLFVIVSVVVLIVGCLVVFARASVSVAFAYDGFRPLGLIAAAVHRTGLARTAAITIPVPVAAIAFIILVTLGGVVLLLLAQKGLTVGQWDLVIVGVDFRKGKEAMAVAAIFHEGRLERWLDAGYLCEVDIPLELTASRAFEVEFFDAVAANHDDAGFLRVGCVDEHFAAHDV